MCQEQTVLYKSLIVKLLMEKVRIQEDKREDE